MKVLIIVIIVIVLGLGGYYFLTKNQAAPMPMAPVDETTTEVTPVSPPAQTSTPTTAPQSVSVSIKNFVFSPATLSVKAGAKVTWTNNDSVAHTVTSDSGNLLNSGTIAPGQSWSFTFTSAGTASYHCAFHPNMKASISVTN